MVISENGKKEERYVKLLVDVDLTKPLIRVTNISFEGEKRWVMFKYEQLPLFCFYCGKIGYRERNCGKKMTDSRISDMNKGQYGEWLRAAYVRSSNKKVVMPKRI